MNDAAIRFRFEASVPMAEVEATLRLATMAVDSLFGPYRVALEARCRFDAARRLAVIDTASEVGRTLALIFRGYIEREFGDDGVRVTTAASEPPVAGGVS